MKNINKNKINYRNIIKGVYYSKYLNRWKIEYTYDYKVPQCFRKPKTLRDKKLAIKYNIIGKRSLANIKDSWDDFKISRNYKSWKDRTKRRHQYKNEECVDFYFK